MHRIVGSEVVKHLRAALTARHQVSDARLEQEFRTLLLIAPDDPEMAAIELLCGWISSRHQLHAEVIVHTAT